MYNLQFNQEKVQRIVNILVEKPFKEVVDLIQDIQVQCNNQDMAKQQEANKPPQEA